MENQSRIHEYFRDIKKHGGTHGEAGQIMRDITNSQRFYIGEIEGFFVAHLAPDVNMLETQFNLPFPAITVEGLAPDGLAILIYARQVGEQFYVRTAHELGDEPGAWGSSPEAPMTWDGTQYRVGCGNDEEIACFAACFAAVQLLCRALRCENVRAQSVRQAQTSRSRMGREPPRFSHNVVVVTPTDADGEVRSGGGTHASPRIHLRRGHVRRLADGREIWIQPTVVGDKSRGMVTKDYVVQ